MFKHESQYSFLKNLFLSFLIVNFYFVVKLFSKAHRGILKQHPL
ncbi:membrane protein [Helicobacter pylori]|nr:membrane protein [Helicobacter pylori]